MYLCVCVCVCVVYEYFPSQSWKKLIRIKVIVCQLTRFLLRTDLAWILPQISRLVGRCCRHVRPTNAIKKQGATHNHHVLEDCQETMIWHFCSWVQGQRLIAQCAVFTASLQSLEQKVISNYWNMYYEAGGPPASDMSDPFGELIIIDQKSVGQIDDFDLMAGHYLSYVQQSLKEATSLDEHGWNVIKNGRNPTWDWSNVKGHSPTMAC